MAFGSVSAGCTLKLQPYKVDVEPIAVQDLQTLLKLSRLGPSTYENSADARFGVTMEWMSKAKQHWEGAGFDW